MEVVVFTETSACLPRRQYTSNPVGVPEQFAEEINLVERKKGKAVPITGRGGP
jgi:BarA-like signal transduction histidine kinase